MVVVPGGWLVAPVAPVVGVGLAVLDVARFEAAFRVLALGWPPHDVSATTARTRASAAPAPRRRAALPGAASTQVSRTPKSPQGRTTSTAAIAT